MTQLQLDLLPDQIEKKSEAIGKTVVSVQVVSDLHLEFLNDLSLLKHILTEADVLVIAGDIAPIGYKGKLQAALNFLCDRYNFVVYVPGNHEYYGTSITQGNKELDKLPYGNLYILSPEYHADILGLRFIGGSLWFPYGVSNKSYENLMNDFWEISDSEKVYRIHEETKEKLKRDLTSNSVLVTHHLPSWKSVSQKYIGHVLNRFFVGNIEDIIEDCQPLVAIHGHTHDSFDYQLGPTRVICNPYGYRGENRKFIPKLILEI